MRREFIAPGQIAKIENRTARLYIINDPHCYTLTIRIAETYRDYRQTRYRMAYRLEQHQIDGTERVTIFRGNDFAPSPMHPPVSSRSLYDLLSFLTLTQYDTDPDYFASYTPDQIAWRDAHAEALQNDLPDQYR